MTQTMNPQDQGSARHHGLMGTLDLLSFLLDSTNQRNVAYAWTKAIELHHVDTVTLTHWQGYTGWQIREAVEFIATIKPGLSVGGYMDFISHNPNLI